VIVPVIEAVTSWLQAHGKVAATTRNVSRKQQNAVDDRLIITALQGASAGWVMLYSRTQTTVKKKMRQHCKFLIGFY
jgi:hypothetical protein